MPEDRLRHDRDDVENLEDIIEARDQGSSHLSRDVDAFEKDFDVPEDIDVDEALTFPHPKRKKDPNDGVELMDTPRKEDIGVDWEESQHEMLPSDYRDDYDDALTTDLYDEDTVVEEEIGVIGDVNAGDLTDDMPLVTPLPRGFHVEDESGEDAATSSGRKGGSSEIGSDSEDADTSTDETDRETPEGQ